MIDWTKIKSYNNDKRRSFEELCYQIALELYKDKGTFTNIDDSGGGDGVEFYMTFPNGDVWGWQAKFYFPDKRLSSSNRKPSIIRSLKNSFNNHPKLKKWFLCTPTNFTPDKTIRNRKTKGELSWFKENLPNYLPDNHSVDLVHWGDSDFNNWLSESRFKGKLHYFFDELDLNLEWFNNQYRRELTGIGRKYEPILHIKSSVEEEIHDYLCDEIFVKDLTNIHKKLLAELERFKNFYSNFKRSRAKIEKSKEISVRMTSAIQEAEKLISQTMQKIKLLDGFFTHNISDLDKEINIDRLKETLNESSDIIWNSKQNQHTKLMYDLTDSGFSILSEIELINKRISRIKQSNLHILGDASTGKTHLVCNFVNSYLINDHPAILILGRSFSKYQSIETQILSNLDIPNIYSLHDLIKSLNAAAIAYQTKIPIVIDGLNESEGIDIWKNDLQKLIHYISESDNILLITTCRRSYRKAIWSDNTAMNFKVIYGFNSYNVDEAIEKYFSYYKIKADLSSIPKMHFENPIYLRIFCEIKNPKRQNEVSIHIGDQTLFEVFEEFLEKCNNTICDKLKYPPTSKIITKIVKKLAKYLWYSNTQFLSLNEMLRIAEEKEIDTNDFDWDKSKTKAILDEGLLVCRDYSQTEEIVYFTYDLFAGYLIASELLMRISEHKIDFFSNLKYLKSKIKPNKDIKANKEYFRIISCFKKRKINEKVFNEDYKKKHPLSDDIARCLAGLLPSLTNFYLHDVNSNKYSFQQSVLSLFEISPKFINEECLKLIDKIYKIKSNRYSILSHASHCLCQLGHPLNIEFFSSLFHSLSITENDISWTEFLRETGNLAMNIMEELEEYSKFQGELNMKEYHKIHVLAKFAMWTLSTTIHDLRDKATRALYWYGRKFPEYFLGLVEFSFTISDPYIKERMLAALYGIVMAKQHEQDNPEITKFLSIVGKKLYDMMFKENAEFSTTHILMRDYARLTIEITLIYCPDIINSNKLERIRPPFKDGGIRNWEKSDDKNELEYRDGNAPLHMDFKNYTLGSRIRKRANYDFELPEYKELLGKIYWRLYDLGYSLDIFGEIDKEINRQDFNSRQLKIDRYGKKYSWIAFYELMGFRNDNGLLNLGIDEKRISECDIDPSFPEELPKTNMVQNNFLNELNKPIQDWISEGPNPIFDSFLVNNHLYNNEEEWILLYGLLYHRDGDSNREIDLKIRSCFSESENFNRFITLLKKQSSSNLRFPEIPKDSYTYAGEIPWCETYPDNDWEDLSLVSHEEIQKSPEKILMMCKDDKKIIINTEDIFSSMKELTQIYESIMDSKGIDKPMEIESNLFELLEKEGYSFKEEVAEIEKTVEIRENYSVFIPYRCNSWETYHSNVIPARYLMTLAKEITEELNLINHPQTFNLFDRKGNIASLAFEFEEEGLLVQNYLFLRRDLLEKYLSMKDLSMTWIIKGERAFYSKDVNEIAEYRKNNILNNLFMDIRIL